MINLIRNACYKTAQGLKQRGLTAKRTHLHEIISAMLGYSSYAALIKEESDTQLDYHFADAEFIVLNKLKAKERAEKLGVPAVAISICIEEWKTDSLVPVFESLSDFCDEHLREAFEVFIYDQLGESGVMAESNASFENYPDMDEDFKFSGDLWTSPEEWSIEDSGTLVGEYDPDGHRVFNGDTLIVSGRLTYSKAGRAGLIFLPESSDVSASEDDTWRDHEEMES